MRRHPDQVMALWPEDHQRAAKLSGELNDLGFPASVSEVTSAALHTANVHKLAGFITALRFNSGE